MRPPAILRKNRASRRSTRHCAFVEGCLAIILPLLAGAALYAADPLPSEKQAHSAQSTVCQTFRVRDQDQVWFISTRHLGCYIPSNQPTLQFFRYEKGFWQPKSEAEFFAADSPDLVTPFYIHGNWVAPDDASSQGLSLYFELAGKFDAEPPVRFVIWSWPSERVKGFLHDVRDKAARSDIESYYLATFLARMHPDVRVGLLGYSFGARIISGSLHLFGGGSLFGRSLPPAPRPQFRVAFWAAAEHNHWYLPGQFHDRALASADAWFITVNPCDPVLARYDLLEKCGCPVAVGYAGIYGRNLLPPDVNARIEEVNVSNIVGNDHHWRSYFYSLYIQNRTRDYVLWHEIGLNRKQEPQAVAAAK